MDEIWQRHKVFILQCLIGGLVFLIALVVMGNAYSGIDVLQQSNANLRKGLEKRKTDKSAPSPRSIADQKRKAEAAMNDIHATAAQVASLAQSDEDFVRENIVWVLATIGKERAESERFLSLYKQLPQTCLTSVREEARAVLVGRAAQRGRQIDEQFGLAGIEDEDVPGALQALAITCDVIHRCLEREGIQSVSDIRVNARNTLDKDLKWVSGVDVRLSMVGDPEDVMAVLRSFNGLDSHPKRMTVVREVESILRPNPEADTVKATVLLLGLRYKDAQGEDR